ncbi:MAG: histidine ammonia-lyase [Bacteroidales bacterium]|nr:histidine ammonia-lyase [Bacteroidales bacterium]MCF8327622.1 histidine ammonia-lyase [Bacteroidales bacterium]
MSNTHNISPKELTFERIAKLLNEDYNLALSDESRELITKCRNYLDTKMNKSKEPVYGVNTGFGSLCNVSISSDQLEQLQENLVKSHACGSGEPVPRIIVKIMLLLKIHALSFGNSGVQLSTVERLIELYNHNVLPVIYQLGSLGASGDLAPLAHLSLPLLGEGEVYFQGEKRTTKEVYKKLGWEPIQLKSKEGLALLNGTQFMSAFGVYLSLRIFKLSKLADVTAAVSLDAFDGRIEPFHPKIQSIRPHAGQTRTAKRIRNILEGSELINRSKQHVQDPYSFRTIPQVHGASKDAINYAANVVRTEINSVTDNPTIFPDDDLIISAGNFHGQPLALALDNMAIAMAELGNIAERRTYQLLSGSRNLPAFLVAKPGLNSGFMIPQYTAASIVSQNKQLATPASVDSIESSQGQEDHVSMGANAATKAFRVLENLEKIIAIELFNAAQALEFRKPAKSSPFVENFVAQFRNYVPFIDTDQVMYNHINKSVEFLQNVNLDLPDEGIFKYPFKNDLRPLML